MNGIDEENQNRGGASQSRVITVCEQLKVITRLHLKSEPKMCDPAQFLLYLMEINYFFSQDSFWFFLFDLFICCVYSVHERDISRKLREFLQM